MHVEVLEELENFDRVLEEANDVKVLLRKGWRDISQVGLQAHKPDLNYKDFWQESINQSYKLSYPENYYKYPLFDIPTINRLMDKYAMKRTRIMLSGPRTNLSFHSDMTKRIHIPLFTNEDCIMIIEDNIYRLEPGKVYLTNTTLKHNAVNGSGTVRGHIVGCVY